MEHSYLLQRFDQHTAVRLLAVAGPDSGTPLAAVAVRHLGGALADLPGTAVGYDQARSGVAACLREPYLVHALGIPMSPEAADGIRAAFTGLGDALKPDAVDRAPYNFLGTRGLSDAYGPSQLARLQAIKRERDPHNLIRGHRPVLAA